MGPDTDDYQTREASGDSAAAPVCGERLAATRRERGISIREIAKELHLDEPKVRALEENRFEVLGAPVFAKGHMRKYAELVGVAIDDVLADYYQLNRSAGAPPVVGPPRKVRHEIPIGRWVGTVVAVLVLASTTWWWYSRVPETDPIAVAPAEAERQDDPAQILDVAGSGVDDSVEPELPSPVDDQQIADTETISQPEATPVVEDDSPDVQNAVVGENVELTLSFTGDCWTEVSDALGRRLFYSLGTEGRSVTVSGVEPLGVLLGSSSNVSIQVNGFDYSIPAASRRGNTARLTIFGQ